MGTIRVVLDTNVLVSALGFGGTPLEAVLRTFEDDVALLASEESLAELDRVMRYDRLPFTTAERVQFVSILRDEASVLEPGASIEAARDPDDDLFLELAVGGEADYLVSGDTDLLDIDTYAGVAIVTPGRFLVEADGS